MPLAAPAPVTAPAPRAHTHVRSVHRLLGCKDPRPRRLVLWQAAALLAKMPLIMGALQKLADEDEDSFADIPLTEEVIEYAVQNVLPELPLEQAATANEIEQAATAKEKAGQVS